MRSYLLPLRYILVLVLIITAMLCFDFYANENTAILKNSIFESPFVVSMLNTVFVAIFILVLYSIGVYLLVRRIPDRASQAIAVRIFITILVALGIFLGLLEWIDDPVQIVLVIGIVWGALVVALRDLIQNMVGSLVLLVNRIYRIGDRIQVRGVYGQVLDIGFFRTSLMVLDRDTGDSPDGDFVTIPNGILFRETITNMGRTLTVRRDQIQVTVPFTADLEGALRQLEEIIRRHTMEFENRAEQEISRLGERKILPEIEIKPSSYLGMSDYGVVVTLKYFTDVKNRSAVRNAIIGDISRIMPDIAPVEKWT